MLYHDDGAFRGCAFIKYENDEDAHGSLELNGASVFAKEHLVVRMAEDKRTNQRKKVEAIQAHKYHQQPQKQQQELGGGQQKEIANGMEPPMNPDMGMKNLAPWNQTQDLPILQPMKDNCWTQQMNTITNWAMMEARAKWEHAMMTHGLAGEFDAVMMSEGFSVWTEYHIGDGTPYYHNAMTGLTQWERPKELDPESATHETSALDDAGRYGPTGCNLFVFHLPDEWMDNDLQENFSPFGNIVSAKVMKESATQRSRGFGFVSYDCRDSATLAIKKMQGFKAGNKRLKVEFKKGETPGSLFDDDVDKPMEKYESQRNGEKDAKRRSNDTYESPNGEEEKGGMNMNNVEEAQKNGVIELDTTVGESDALQADRVTLASLLEHDDEFPQGDDEFPQHDDEFPLGACVASASSTAAGTEEPEIGTNGTEQEAIVRNHEQEQPSFTNIHETESAAEAEGGGEALNVKLPISAEKTGVKMEEMNLQGKYADDGKKSVTGVLVESYIPTDEAHALSTNDERSTNEEE